MGPHWLFPEGAPINKTKRCAELRSGCQDKGKGPAFGAGLGLGFGSQLANSARMVVSVRE